ncbi:unnamed protein product [Paramecium octaurelia]|uniref:Uncharacterized protein n=1 Tax=Paramecium octaurelia TaxID=43137 RepID=A0A8S1UJJ8_PAROT|nr:unnamed protein product [Paramecium octaurelia]
MKTKGQGEIKYLTPINKKPRIITNLSTKTRISTSNQNSILSFDINSISSPRLSPLKTDRYVFKKKMSLTTTPSTKTTLYSTKSTQKINNKF